MKLNILFILMFIYQCRGHGDVVKGIFHGVHEAHSNLHKVAGSFLGGITHGLGLSLQGHVGVSQTGLSQGHYQGAEPDQTILVVEEKDEPENNVPNRNEGEFIYNHEYHHPYHHHHNQQGHDYPPNHGHRPGYSNQPSYNPGYGCGQQNYDSKPGYGGNHPNYGSNPGYGNNQQKYGNQPHHGGNSEYGNNQHNYENKPEHQPHHDSSSFGDDQQNYGNRPSYGGSHYGNNRPSYGNRPYSGNNHGHWVTDSQPDDGNNKPDYGNNQQDYGNNEGNNKPDYGMNENDNKPNNESNLNNIFNKPTGNPKPIPEITTKKPENDAPLFIPLNPNLSDYGVPDVSKDNEPKRETISDSAVEADEDLAIDKRIKQD